MENKSINKKSVCTLIGISLAVILLMGLTYAWLTQVLNGTKINKITAGTLELTLDDNASDGIDLEYAIPQSNEQGLSNTAYTFTVKNTGSINAAYKLYLEDEEIEGTRIDDSNIKYNLVKNNSENNPRLLSTTIEDNKRILENTIIDGNSTDTYSLKLWIDSEATQSEVANKVFKARIKLEAVQSEDSSDDEYEVKGKIEKEEEPKTCEGGSVVVYPGGTTAVVDNECGFTIPSSKPGEYTVYYVPSGVDPNRPEEEIKNDPLVIPTRIIVGIDPRVIKPAQGYNMILDVTKKPKAVYKYMNSHIKGLYAYKEDGTGEGLAYTGCLGGEEAGCKDVKSKVDSNPSIFPVGTIVKYEVAPGVEKYFNVIKDNGDTLVMQQRENTVENKEWNSSGITANGPSTDSNYVLGALEAATVDWEYVNNQTYSIGDSTSTLGDSYCGGYNHQDYKIYCSGSEYTLSRTTKARMITVQELTALDCRWTEKKCKKFVNNYLKGTTEEYGGGGGTFATDANYCYWTMSVGPISYDDSFYEHDTAYYACRNGKVGSYPIDGYDGPFTKAGGRAVVVVNK